MGKKLIYVLLPIQILVLLLSPRFGWSIHYYDATSLQYDKTLYVDGEFHSQYSNENDVIDICYESIFSRKLSITVNDTDVYYMEVELDGNISDYNPELLQFTASDLVWQDSCGIFYWRYILTIILTVFSIGVFNRARGKSGKKNNALYICSIIVYLISILISLRIIL